MNILVCGGACFIGSAFIRNYLKNNPDFKILNLDILTFGSNLENLKNIKKPSETTKTKSKQKAKLLKKTPLKVKNKPKMTHMAKPTSVPIKNKSGNKPATPIVPATTADEPEYSHPMDTICGGSNRLRSGCR